MRTKTRSCVPGPGLAAVLGLFVLTCTDLARAGETLHDSGRLAPGTVALYEILPAQGLVHRMDTGALEDDWHLTEAASQAVHLAPAWLQVELADRLGRLDDALQDRLASLLQEAAGEDPRLVDEVAFALAHLARDDYAYADERTGVPFDPEILLENARWIYAADELLPYVRLKEYGEPGPDANYWTTAVYRILGPTGPEDYEIPREVYYWWVVHPRISGERVLYVRPPTDLPAAPEEGGRFWREYFWADRNTPDDFSRPFVLRVPNTISDQELCGWGPSASGWLSSSWIDPIPEVVRADGRPVLLRYTYHPPGTGNGYNGTVLVTTIPVEKAYLEGHTALLENLLSLGDGNVRIIPYYSDNRILVVKDRDPFGEPVVEQALSELGYSFDVMDSTTFAGLAGPEDLADYEKVVVPSDQPRRLYERLTANATVIEQWVGRSDKDADMVFEFHGAVAPEHLPADDWTDLEMPTQFVGHDLQDATDVLRGWGYPKLLDVMPACEYAWDGRVYEGLSGDRTLDPTAVALDRLGYLVSQNLDDNVSEIPADWQGPDGDCGSRCVVRSMNAVRIAYGHYENCGGIAILFTALARASLLPAAKVSGMPEDHEWNEFYLLDAWRSFQVDWSDGATRIDRPGNKQDKDFGGGKDLSMVFAWRGDGLALDAMERYSKTVRLTVEVTDASGLPVDGATVLVASESYYDPNSLTLATVEVTDASGVASFLVGDHQNFFIQVTSPVGSWPDDEHVQWVACAEPGASGPNGAACPEAPPWDETATMPTTDEPDTEWTIPVRLSGRVSSLDATPGEPWPEGPGQLRLTVRVPHAILDQEALLPASSLLESASLNVYLLDFPNLQRLLAGQSFAYARKAVFSGYQATSLEVSLPDSDAWYVLLANDNSVATVKGFEVWLELRGSQAETDGGTGEPDAGTEEEPSSGRGCTCRSADGPSLLPLLGLLILWRRRRPTGAR